jgi:hypothetical protein
MIKESGQEKVIRFIQSNIRTEEWVLLVFWAVYTILCLTTKTGLNLDLVFLKYFKFFAVYIVWMFFITRIIIPYADGWEPKEPLLEKLKHFAFRKQKGMQELIATDKEVVRGCFVLFGSLSCYSNLKQRIPGINSTIGDPFFAKLDEILVGPNFAPWMEEITRENKWLRDFLGDTYMHGYFWMVVLLFLAYMRRDRSALRWIFNSVAFTYLVALLITVIYPSYGLFFLEPERFDWINGGIERSQNMLIRTYNKNMPLIDTEQTIYAKTFAGIAAFPSLHIGHMIILFLIALKMFRVYALVIIGVTFFTFMATIAFGWHYSVDAIGGLVVACFVTFSLHLIIYKESLFKSLRKSKSKE